MPAVGLGTWQSKPNEVRHAVRDALLAGYRHIDTALAYGNENEVGQGIKDSGVPREQIWITTKLDNPWHKRVTEGIDSSLKSLDCGYVDLYVSWFISHVDCPISDHFTLDTIDTSCTGPAPQTRKT